MNSAARVVLEKCMALKKDEKCLILADSESREIGDAFLKEALMISNNSEKEMIPIPEFHGQEPPEKTAKKMLEADVIIMPTTKSLSWTKARKEACKNGARIASMPTITDELMHFVDIDYAKLKESTLRLLKMLKGKKILRITNDKGTDIEMSVKGREWFGHDAGDYSRPGTWGNLPTGELCTAPVLESVNGTLVVDASMAGIGKLKTPLKITIEHGFASKIEGGEEADAFRKMLDDVKDRNAFAVAEIGIGTNRKAKVVGVVLVDEKVYGTAHIAFGKSKDMGGTVDVQIHVDGVFTKPTIYADDSLIMKEGDLV